MKFEVVRTSDRKVLASTEYTQSIYAEDVLVSLAVAGHIFKINGKPMSTKQVIEYCKDHPDERPEPRLVTESEEFPEIIIDDYTVLEPVKVLEPEIPQVTPKPTPPAPKPDDSEPFTVAYTRYIENGKYDKTYDQLKGMKTFDLAKAFIDKKINQKSRFWAGATITDAREGRIIYSVDVDYKIEASHT